MRVPWEVGGSRPMVSGIFLNRVAKDGRWGGFLQSLIPCFPFQCPAITLKSSFYNRQPFSVICFAYHWIPNTSCRLSGRFDPTLVGVPLAGGVDGFHRRVGCVKPDDLKATKPCLTRRAASAVAVLPTGDAPHWGMASSVF